MDWPRPRGTVAIRRLDVDDRGAHDAIESWVVGVTGGQVKVKPAAVSESAVLRAGSQTDGSGPARDPLLRGPAGRARGARVGGDH